jgi:hypothetical protein
VILRREGDAVLGITQTAHSALTGRLAEAWVPRDDLPWDDLCTAAAIHDLGWAPWELDPQLDPRTGLPHAFHEVPDGPYEEIWARGTDEAATFGRLAGLLVSRHFTRLAGRRAGLAALVERERRRQAALVDDLGLDNAVLDACSDLLAGWDGLSLDLCGGREPELDAWPFAKAAFTAAVEARELPAGPLRAVAVRLERPRSG